MTDFKKPPKILKNRLKPPREGDFDSPQIDIFRGFLCNAGDDDLLSNTFDLWDCVPRYSVTRQAMDKMRKTNTFPQLLSIPFQYRGAEFVTVIQPAWIDQGEKGIIGYYPSANEELVEDALRKIATEQRQGYFDKESYSSGVVFTLHRLREELKKRGHTRSYYETVLSLSILAGSNIEISNKTKSGFTKCGYFTSLTAASREKLDEDPNAKWIVQFHPLVTQGIDTLAYRQFNYAQMMGHRTQLARWLHKQLSLKFTFASLASTFEMRFSTIKRDSGLLDGYKQERQAVVALDSAFNELKSNGILLGFDKSEIRSSRGKLDDVVYTLTPSMDFVSSMKAANKRKILMSEKLTAI